MKKKAWARTATRAGALAAGLLLFVGSGAQAAELVTSDNSTGVDGAQVLLPLQAPLDLCGDRVDLGGEATADCLPPAGARALFGPGAIADMHSHDNAGIANGIQVQAPAQVPVNACGVTAAVLGTAHGSCAGTATAVLGTGPGIEHGSPVMDTRGNEGVLNGVQVLAPVQVPVNLCGIAVSGLGTAHASCAGSATATRGATVDMHTGDNHGVGNGNQVAVPVQVPVNVCGNAVAALGDANADCHGDGDAAAPRTTTAEAPRAAVAPQVAPAATLPLLGGSASSSTGSDNQSVASSEHADVISSLVSEGSYFLGDGNELLAPVQGPSNVEGLAIGLGSTAGAASLGGATAVS